MIIGTVYRSLHIHYLNSHRSSLQTEYENWDNPLTLELILKASCTLYLVVVLKYGRIVVYNIEVCLRWTQNVIGGSIRPMPDWNMNPIPRSSSIKSVVFLDVGICWSEFSYSIDRGSNSCFCMQVLYRFIIIVIKIISCILCKIQLSFFLYIYFSQSYQSKKLIGVMKLVRFPTVGFFRNAAISLFI